MTTRNFKAKNGLDVIGNITVTGTVAGRDLATDGTKLDNVASGADATPAWVPSSDPGYLTAHPSIAAASSVDNTGRTYIQDITLDANGHVTGITSATETVSAASAWPVGSIFVSTVSTNPATLLGFGTWVEFGAGRVPVGQNTGDGSFDTLEETGGSKNATLVSHTHTTADSRLSASNAINWVLGGVGSVNVARSGTTAYMNVGDPPPGSYRTQMRFTTQEDTITSSTAGSSSTNANLQPYIVVKMWKRTA